MIRTRRTDFSDIYVSRRYGDFKTLADELRKHHPEEMIRPPPAKDRTVVSGTSAAAGSSDLSGNPADSSESLTSASAASLGLAREKNRLTLRAYLHALMSSGTIASSPVLQSFLISGPTMLTYEELQDASRREEVDRMREEGRKRFAKEIASRVDSLRDAVRSVKGDIMGPGWSSLKNGVLLLIMIFLRRVNTRFRYRQDSSRCNHIAWELSCCPGMGACIVSFTSFII